MLITDGGHHHYTGNGRRNRNVLSVRSPTHNRGYQHTSNGNSGGTNPTQNALCRGATVCHVSQSVTFVLPPPPPPPAQPPVQPLPAAPAAPARPLPVTVVPQYDPQPRPAPRPERRPQPMRGPFVYLGPSGFWLMAPGSAGFGFGFG